MSAGQALPNFSYINFLTFNKKNIFNCFNLDTLEVRRIK